MAPPGFPIGSRVTHAKFGRGDVIGRRGTGEAMKLEIRFVDGVTRLLAVRFVQPL
jgi:hypothetical protein